MRPPTLEEAVAWGLAVGAGLAVAVGMFFGLCALLGVDWSEDRERKP